MNGAPRGRFHRLVPFLGISFSCQQCRRGDEQKARRRFVSGLTLVLVVTGSSARQQSLTNPVNREAVEYGPAKGHL